MAPRLSVLVTEPEATTPAPIETELRQLHRLAQRLAGNAHDAEDLAQDAALIGLGRAPAACSSLRTWLATVLRHHAFRRRRNATLRTHAEHRAARIEAQPAASDVVATASLHRRIADEVMALAEPYRSAVVLRFLNDLPLAEVARRLGVPLETARTRIKRGLHTLRQRLDASYGKRGAWLGLLVTVPSSPTPLLAAAAVLMSFKPLACVAGAALALTLLWLRPFAPTPLAPPSSSEPVAGAPMAADLDRPHALPTAAPPSERQAVPAAPPAVVVSNPNAITGRVVVAHSQAPVPGATVTLRYCEADEFDGLDLEYSQHETELASVRTDADGRFQVPAARAQLHRLRVTAAGFAPHGISACAGGTEVTVALELGAALEGTVLAQGKPLPGVPIRVRPSGLTDQVWVTTTTDDGSFWVAGLPPQRMHVQVHSPDHAEHWAAATLSAGQTHRVDIELAPGRRVSGLVREASTQLPIAGAEVADSWTFKRTVRTDADGRFALPDVRRDHADIHVRCRGYTRQARALGRGKDDSVVEFELAKGGGVKGRIVDRDGKALPSAYVAVAASYFLSPSTVHTDWHSAVVGNDGRFEATGLRPDLAYTLMARRRGFGTRLYDLPAGAGTDQPLDLGDLRMLEGGGLEGRVLDEASAPVADAEVSIRGSNDDRTSAFGSDEGGSAAGRPRFDAGHHLYPRERRTAHDGSFRFAGLAQGTYRLSITRPGHIDPIDGGAHAVTDGKISAPVDVVVPRGATIRGRVKLDAGLPAADFARIQVMAFDRESMRYYDTGVAADGGFCFGGLPVQSYVISAQWLPAGLAALPLRDIAVDGPEVVLNIVKAHTIEGRVVSEDGHDVAARVTIATEDQPFGWYRETAADGTFKIEVAPDCVGHVTAGHPSDPALTATVRDVAAGARGLVLRLARVPMGK